MATELTIERTTHAARESAVVHVSRDRIVHVRGDDARSWLSGQTTADLKPLSAAHAVYALSLTVKGRIVTDLWAVETPEGISMVLPAGTAEHTLEALDKHIIMEDVELVPDDALTLISVQGPAARELLEAAQIPRSYGASRLSDAGLDAWVSSAEREAVRARLEAAAADRGALLLDQDAWEALHVALAVPRAGVDFNADAYPQEAGLKGRALAFNKGCYLGQEVVYMLENRGQLARRLVQLQGPSAMLAPGAQLSDAEGKKIAQVTSRAEHGAGGALALAYVRKPHWEVGAALHAQGLVAHITHVVGSEGNVCPVVAS